MKTNLLAVRNDIKNRFEDIQTMIDTLDKNPTVCCQLVLKSSLMLMFYNVVEGTISNLLTELFDTIVKRNLTMEVLPFKLQNTLYTYHLKKIGEDSNKLKEFSKYDSLKLCNISYLEISKYLKLFSGNLDARTIRNISKKVGIDLPEIIDEPSLLKIKSARNKLAHGEAKFSNACQDITLDEMKKMCKKLEEYLYKVIYEYEYFLDRLH